MATDRQHTASIEIIEEPVERLADYGEIPISFQVDSRLRPVLIENGPGGIRLVEEPVTPPYIKEYDGIADEGPTRWARRWDISHWGVFSAFASGKRVGDAVVAWRTPNVTMLEDRDDLAVLWDLRVHPDYRGRRIGARLFKTAE